MKELIKKTREYLDYIEEHYDNVQKAWDIIQKAFNGSFMSFMYDDYRWYTLDAEIKYHDKSKLSIAEFQAYRFNFFPTDDEKNRQDYKTTCKALFDKAWEHHKSRNSHHWQSWVNESNSYAWEIDVVHNFCDWAAMAMKFGGKPLDYYEKNKDRIKLPESGIKFLYELQDGYLKE